MDHVVTCVTHNITVTVEPFYQRCEIKNHSPLILLQQLNTVFVFNYRITIENHNSFAVKVLGREYSVYDCNPRHGNPMPVNVNRQIDPLSNCFRMLTGKGINGGKMPVLGFNESYQYCSSISMKSEIGYMTGYFVLFNTQTRETCDVKVPVFKIEVPHKLN